jgi:hypothetical protein
MTAQPPQREYIITEEQLQRGHEIMSKTGRKKYEREIRIRPHPPAPDKEIDTTTIHDLINWIRIADEDSDHEPWTYSDIKRVILAFEKEAMR